MTDEEIYERFPIGARVSGPNGEAGVVKAWERAFPTGYLQLMVRWDGTGITAQTQPWSVQPAAEA